MTEAFNFAKQSFIAQRDYYPYKGRGNSECKQKGNDLFPK